MCIATFIIFSSINKTYHVIVLSSRMRIMLLKCSIVGTRVKDVLNVYNHLKFFTTGRVQTE